MRSAWGLVLVLASTTAHAEDILGTITLTTADEVAGLCEEVADSGPISETTAAGLYRISVPPQGFSFEKYDSRTARLAVDTSRAFRGIAGAWELVLYDLDGEIDPGVVLLDLAVPASADEAKALAKAHKGGLLSLVVWFRVAAQADDSPACAIVHSKTTDSVRLAIEPLAFALEKGGDEVARGETSTFAALREAAAEERPPIVEPSVTVSAPLLTNTRAKASAKVAKAAAKLEDDLLACYQDALADDDTLRGSLVIGLTIDGKGIVTEAHAEIDGLGADAVTECALEAARAVKFPAAEATISIPLRFGAR